MRPKNWDLRNIKNGFEKFYEEHNRYPTANEIDDYESLPSSRQIQRRFGGLVNLRKQLGLEITNHGIGEERSKIAIGGNKEGFLCENKIRNILQNAFGEIFVHVEKPANNDYKNRFDFYVYANPYNFAVDVFSTRDRRTFIKNMNVKINKYNKVDLNLGILYFVYFCHNLTEVDIRDWILKSTSENRIHNNWKIVSLDEFIIEIKKYSALELK